MKNRPVETPLGRPERVGKYGYQLFSAHWPDGNVNFFAKVGLHYRNDDTGETYIIPKMYLRGASDHRRAGDEAEQKLQIIESSWKARQSSETSVTLELVRESAGEVRSKSDAA